MEREGITYQNLGIFIGMVFHTKNNSKARLLITSVIANGYLHPKSTMRLPVVATVKEAKEKKQTNKKYWGGFNCEEKGRIN